MTGFLLALAAFSATLAGGLFALKFRAGLHFILAFTAGVLLGVVSFGSPLASRSALVRANGMKEPVRPQRSGLRWPGARMFQAIVVPSGTRICIGRIPATSRPSLSGLGTNIL